MGLKDERELTLKVTISADEDLETLEIFLAFALFGEMVARAFIVGK